MLESVTSRAKAICKLKKPQFEEVHQGQFVVIEPDSGEVFLANSFDAAIPQAVACHPHRVSHTIRIGNDAALHFGSMTTRCERLV